MQALWMLVASFMFAIMGASVKLASEHAASLSLVILFRGLPSVVLLVIWALLTRKSLKPKSIRLHLMRNVFGVGAMWMAFYGYSVLPLATSTSLNYTSPLFIAGFLLLSGRAANDIVRTIAVGLGFAGVLLILRPSITEDQWFACALGLTAGACGAVAMMQVRQLGTIGEPIWRTVMFFSIFVTGTSLVGIKAHGIGEPDIVAWVALLVCGLSGLFGQLALTRAFGSGSPLLSAALQYTTIIFSACIGILVWQNAPDVLAWLGMAMVIMAGLLSAWRTLALADRQKKTQVVETTS
ncbi:membrane protein [Advenella kashmirensis W13003]|uniref:Membrane protein n=1 Tax=Advenella kashmirensis W13003 TaxID=1424334 RepID=V8QN00_9BURK|nr:DMT family transporter [Advenella kashmirensis]ETF00374.1 membrane protein [Advenella kashmirensis W13003]